MQGLGRQFPSAKEAIETYRQETGCIDQDLPAFVVARARCARGKIANGDSVILFNFRGDRAQEISLAFDRKEISTSLTGAITPACTVAGMLEYDGDPEDPGARYLVEPPVIKNTLTEVLCGSWHPRVRPVRNPEVRPCDLFLERQPLRKGRTSNWRPTRRSPRMYIPFDASACHEVRGDHRPHGGGHGLVGNSTSSAATSPTATWWATPAILEAVVTAMEAWTQGLAGF